MSMRRGAVFSSSLRRSAPGGVGMGNFACSRSARRLGVDRGRLRLTFCSSSRRLEFLASSSHEFSFPGVATDTISLALVHVSSPSSTARFVAGSFSKASAIRMNAEILRSEKPSASRP